MNRHISSCDRDYLQSTHTAPHKQWPLLMENQTRPFHPPDSCFIASAPAPHRCFPAGAHTILCASDWLSSTTWSHNCELWVPKSSPSHILMKVCKVLTSSSYRSPVEVAVTTENRVGQRDSKPYSHPTHNAAVNLVGTVFLDLLFQVCSGNKIQYSAFPPLGCFEGSYCHQLVSWWEVHYGDRV